MRRAAPLRAIRELSMEANKLSAE